MDIFEEIRKFNVIVEVEGQVADIFGSAEDLKQVIDYLNKNDYICDNLTIRKDIPDEPGRIIICAYGEHGGNGYLVLPQDEEQQLKIVAKCLEVAGTLIEGAA